MAGTSDDLMVLMQLFFRVLGAIAGPLVGTAGKAIAGKITNAIYSGEMSYENFKKVTEGNMAVVQVDDKKCKELEAEFKKQKFDFCHLPDLDPDNGVTEYAVGLDDLTMLNRFLASDTAKNLGAKGITKDDWLATDPGIKEMAKNEDQGQKEKNQEPKVKDQKEKEMKAKGKGKTTSKEGRSQDVVKNASVPVIDLNKKTINDYQSQDFDKFVVNTTTIDKVTEIEENGKKYWDLGLASDLKDGKTGDPLEVHIKLPDEQVQFMQASDLTVPTVAFVFHLDDENIKPYTMKISPSGEKILNDENFPKDQFKAWGGKPGDYQNKFSQLKSVTEKDVKVPSKAAELTKDKDIIKDVFAK